MTPAPAALRADPEAADERTWLLVAAAVGALVELRSPGRSLAGELGGSLVLAMPGTVSDEDAELAALGFEEQVAGVDRLRATALALPGHVVEGSSPSCASRSARRTRCASRRRSRGSAADRPTPRRATSTRRPSSGCSTARAARPSRARTTTPIRRAAWRAASCSGSTGWASGAGTTRSSRTSRAGSAATTARWPSRWASRSLQAGLLVEKPSVGQRHVFLNSRRAGRHPQAHRRRRRAIRPSSPVISRPVALSRLGTKLFTVRTLARAGIIETRAPRPPRARGRRRCARWGTDPGRRLRASAPPAIPDEPAIIDEQGTITFAELDSSDERDRPALEGRRHRAGDARSRSCAATTAASSSRRSRPRRLGADVLYLNTSFAGPQIAEVCREERPVAMVHDEEFAELVAEALAGMHALRRLADDIPEPTSDRAARSRRPTGPAASSSSPAARPARPKGAGRHHPSSLDPAAALLDMIPLRARERTMIAAPMFHSWGLAHFNLGLTLSTTLVLQRKFDPAATLRAIAEHRVNALIVVPVMLAAPPATPKRESGLQHDLSSLRIIAASGSALPGHLANEVMDEFGDVLYNLYGSTEVAWATIATPEDLRSAPGTAGRPPHGTIAAPLRRGGPRGPARRLRPHLRLQRDAVRRLHGRRRQGHDRRPDVVRRRRALRLRRPAVRRRPRRRDDHLRRRERLPPRGRGPARRPSRDRGGRGDRRRGRRRSASGCARSWSCASARS